MAGPRSGSGAEALSSLTTTPVDDGAATRGAHTLSESVFVLTLPVGRLKGSFHPQTPEGESTQALEKNESIFESDSCQEFWIFGKKHLHRRAPYI